jgi:hypothetical protein
MAIPEEEHGAVLGSQRARQGQNVKGMRKVLIWGTALVAVAFAVMLALFGGSTQQQSSQPPAAEQPANPR